MSKLLKVLALLFAVTLVAAACGNDDDGGGGLSLRQPPPKLPPRQQPKRLRPRLPKRLLLPPSDGCGWALRDMRGVDKESGVVTSVRPSRSPAGLRRR